MVQRTDGTPRPLPKSAEGHPFRPTPVAHQSSEDGHGWLPPQPTVRQRIGPTIKALRQKHQYSLHGLANMAAVSPSHLSRIERGLTVPSYEVLGRIADALGTDLRQLRLEEEQALAVDRELDQLCDYFELPTSTRGELLGLSNPARLELVRAFRRVVRRTA